MKRSSIVASVLITVLLVLGSVGLFSYLKPDQQDPVNSKGDGGMSGTINPIDNNAIPDDWQLFSDIWADYSFYYPAKDSLNIHKQKLKSYTIITFSIANQNSTSQFEFYALHNRNKRPLTEFIQTEDALKAEEQQTDLWRTVDLSPYVTSLTVAEQPALAIQQSEATFPLTGPCEQVLYIGYNEQVVVAKRCTIKESSTKETDLLGQDLYFRILGTLVFNNANRFQPAEHSAISNDPPSTDWQLFTESVAGYSFYYPPTDIFNNGSDSSKKYRHVSILVRHENGAEYVNLYTFDNPDDLPLETFIQTEQALRYSEPTDLWQNSDLSPYLIPFTVAEQPALAIQQSEATFPLTGLCEQVVYITYKKRVIATKLCAGKKGVWELGYKADPAGRKLFFEIIGTLQFNP